MMLNVLIFDLEDVVNALDAWGLIGDCILPLFLQILLVCKTLVFKDFVPKIISGEAPLSLDNIDLDWFLL